jgi:S1-C subfamily serine protease
MKARSFKSVPSALKHPLAAAFLAAGLALTVPAAYNAATSPLTPQQITKLAEAATVIVHVDEPVLNDDGSVTIEQRAGTGFFINNRGDMMTCNHVANQGDINVKIITPDEKTHSATMVYQDVKDDFTVWHVDGVKNNKYLEFGNSAKLVAGDPLVVVGNPFDLGISSSYGRVSNPLTSVATPMPTVQTDAALNPGYSGGPMLNKSGKVVAMSEAIFSPMTIFLPVGQSDGIGYGITSNTIRYTLRAYERQLQSDLRRDIKNSQFVPL